MSRAIEAALEMYLEAVHSVFADERREVGGNSSIRVLLTDDQLLRRLAGAVEERKEFETLTRVTTDEFLPDNSGTTALEFSIRTYLRMSGVYERLFDGERPKVSDVAYDYVRAFRSESRTVTYVAPLQFVDFATPLLDCGAFQIRKMEPPDLALLLHDRTRRVFVPNAAVDAERLCRYPFVCITQMHLP